MYVSLSLCCLLKALHYYWLAAVGGHKEAQYRHAKLLLTNKEHQSRENLNTAIGLLEQSAAAGLTKVGSHGCTEVLLVKLQNAFEYLHMRKKQNLPVCCFVNKSVYRWSL